ncbi:MFS transporter [Ferroplasma acidarmanus]|uniref:Resistance protein NorA n=1 Tax=Ferroplasma acidarmanus Fer1 TaxID=333146 RepID=S0ARZ5_FERAC|nr:MFS transporter [Ferroplasma acidarmanus]AGO60885.1 resistance protein NorA [Ferroplasma acidarmanus Fer1]
MNYGTRAGLVHTARALYALNWMDMAPALEYIKTDMNLTVVELGTLVTAFYVGIAVFQVLGGYLSSYIGDKTTSLIGLLFVSIFAITSGLSVNFTELIVSRFFAGLSAALFFSPALSLLASIVPENKYAFHIGIYNGAFNVGGGVGIIGWAILDQYMGYRIPFIIAGVLTLALFFVLVFLFRNIENIKTNKSDIFASFKKVFSNRIIILVAFIGIAAMVAETILGQFFVYYLESIKYSIDLAGSISSLYLLIGFLGGVLGGYHFSRTKYKIGTFLAINIVLSLLLILIGFVHYYIFIIIIAIAMGMITVYGMSITYTLVRYLARRDLVSLTLSFVNTLQLLVAVAVPIIFTIIVSQYNYELAWVSMGILGLIFVPLIFLAKGNLIKVVPS